MKNNKGFTLIELVIAVATLGVIAAITVPVFFGGNGRTGTVSTAKQGMVRYVHDLYPELEDVRASCANFDSDGDGYIRCSATGVNVAQNDRVAIEAECGWFMNAGQCVPIKQRGRY